MPCKELPPEPHLHFRSCFSPCRYKQLAKITASQRTETKKTLKFLSAAVAVSRRPGLIDYSEGESDDLDASNLIIAEIERVQRVVLYIFYSSFEIFFIVIDAFH